MDRKTKMEEIKMDGDVLYGKLILISEERTTGKPKEGEAEFYLKYSTFRVDANNSEPEDNRRTRYGISIEQRKLDGEMMDFAGKIDVAPGEQEIETLASDFLERKVLPKELFDEVVKYINEIDEYPKKTS